MGAAFCIMLVITPRLQAVLLCCGWMEVCAASLAYGKSVVGVEVQHAATSSQQKGRAFASNDQHQCQPPEGGPFMAVAIDTSTCTGCALLQVLTLPEMGHVASFVKLDTMALLVLSLLWSRYGSGH